MLKIDVATGSPRHPFGKTPKTPKPAKGLKGVRKKVIKGVRDCFNPHSTSCLTSLPLFLAAIVLCVTLSRFYDAVDQKFDAVHRLMLKEEELADVLATRAEARSAVLQARKRLVKLLPAIFFFTDDIVESLQHCWWRICRNKRVFGTLESSDCSFLWSVQYKALHISSTAIAKIPC